MKSIAEQLAASLRRIIATGVGGPQYDKEANAEATRDGLLTLAAFDAQAPVEAHILFGSDPGKQAQTFRFDTAGEREAFISGLSEGNGYDKYNVVDGPDYAVDSEGEIRKFPAEVDPELPLVRIEQTTADNCTCTYVYGMTPAYVPVKIEDGQWEPEEPDAETVSVEIEVCFEDGSHYAELDGDQYRDLDASGEFGAFLAALAKGEPGAADDILRSVSEGQGVRP